MENTENEELYEHDGVDNQDLTSHLKFVCNFKLVKFSRNILTKLK